MSAAPASDPDRPVTEDTAAQWWEEGPADYRGKRRAREDGTPAPSVDDATLRDLVGARVAHWLDDRERHDHFEQAALLRLYDQGHTWATAHALIRQTGDLIDAEARVQLDLMRLAQTETVADAWPNHCPDPVGHHALERGAAQERRLAPTNQPGQCAYCNGWLR